MKTIVFGNQKGGVGKTSLSVTTAAEIAKRNKTALLDFDMQANSTGWSAPESYDPDKQPELVDVLQGKVTAAAAIMPTDTENLYLLPTVGIGGGLKDYVENSREMKINNAVENLFIDIARQGFTYCIVDLSPAFGKLESAAIMAAGEIVTPILADRFSFDGLDSITGNLDELRTLAKQPIAEFKRIVINGIDNRIKRHAEITKGVKEKMKQAIYSIPIDQVFFRAQSQSKMIQQLDAKPETLAEIARLAADLTGGE